MSDLQWVHHRYGGSTADTEGGHYLVQYEQYYGPKSNPDRAERFYARLVRRGPNISLGYHPTAEQAIKACEQHHEAMRGKTE